ncbi:MAG: matrixin family metalloprotease [Phycisphaerae bacterium]
MTRKWLCLAIVLLFVCIMLVVSLVRTGEVYAGGPPGPFQEPPGFDNGNQSEQAEEAIDVHKPITPGGYYARLVLIHYAKPPWAGKPDKEEQEKDYDTYALLGLSWPADVLPVDYFIDPDHAPGGSVDEVEAAFEVWDDATSAELFDAPGVDTTANPSVDEPDYVNTVSWRKVVPPRVIAVTFIWYDPETYEIVDCDVVMNTRKDWGIDTDGEGEGFVLEDAFDVRNIVTHEAGHVVGLDDLYDDIYSELTMYGYSSEGETKKISLENGDRLGCQAIYGE